MVFSVQKGGFCVARSGFLHCKKGVFALQEVGFYTPKTPFLFFVSITNTLLMCYEYSVKWLRTFTKLVANIPPGVGADSSCPYPNIIKNAYFHNQICVSTLLNMYIHFNARTFPSAILWVYSYMRAR